MTFAPTASAMPPWPTSSCASRPRRLVARATQATSGGESHHGAHGVIITAWLGCWPPRRWSWAPWGRPTRGRRARCEVETDAAGRDGLPQRPGRRRGVQRDAVHDRRAGRQDDRSSSSSRSTSRYFDSLVVPRGSKKMIAQFTLEQRGRHARRRGPRRRDDQRRREGRRQDPRQASTSTAARTTSSSPSRARASTTSSSTSRPAARPRSSRSRAAARTSRPPMAAAASGGGGDGSGDGSGGELHGEVHPPPPGGPRQRFITGGVELDVGFRRLQLRQPARQARRGLRRDRGRPGDRRPRDRAVARRAARTSGSCAGCRCSCASSSALNHQVLTTTRHDRRGRPGGRADLVEQPRGERAAALGRRRHDRDRGERRVTSATCSASRPTNADESTDRARRRLPVDPDRRAAVAARHGVEPYVDGRESHRLSTAA